MKNQKIIIDKKSGKILSVYTNEIENILKNIDSEFSIKRVSNINFNNSNKKWEAIDILSNEIIKTANTKKQVYNEEAVWANENLEILTEKHF